MAIAPDRSSTADWRTRLAAWIERAPVQRALIALILLNAAILGLETSPSVMARWGGALTALDQAILAVFVVEIALRLAARGGRFFRDPWSVFDFLVVAIALLPASGPFAVLRALRVLRVLRMLTMVPSMRRVVGGLLAAIPGLGSVFGVIALIFYVASVMATKLFGERFPEWFGTLGQSAYTLFQVMTLESWSMGIARPVIEVYPYAWAFFIPFILIATFTMLNLFIAVIVNAIQSEQAGAADAAVPGGTTATATAAVAGPLASPAPSDPTTALREEVGALRAEIAALRSLLERTPR